MNWNRHSSAGAAKSIEVIQDGSQPRTFSLFPGERSLRSLLKGRITYAHIARAQPYLISHRRGLWTLEQHRSKSLVPSLLG